MKRLVAQFTLGVLVAAAGWGQAQRNPRPRPQPAPQPQQINPFMQPQSIFDTHASRVGDAIAGRAPQLGVPGRRPFFPPPIWIGSGGFAQPAPIFFPPLMPIMNHVTVVQQAPPPVMTVNPDYVADTARPSMREYSAAQPKLEPVSSESKSGATNLSASAPAPANVKQSSVTLIAFKDGSMMQAVAYWYEGDTLHYVKPDHRIVKAAKSDIDRESSERFNRERGLDFRMP